MTKGFEEFTEKMKQFAKEWAAKKSAAMAKKGNLADSLVSVEKEISFFSGALESLQIVANELDNCVVEEGCEGCSCSDTDAEEEAAENVEGGGSPN